MKVQQFRRPDWEPVPRPGCENVQGRVLLARPDLVLALLRFGERATIDRHPAAHPIDVFCLEGSGYVSVGDEMASIESGQRVEWPPDTPHQLWTEGSTMMTLMYERPGERGERSIGR